MAEGRALIQELVDGFGKNLPVLRSESTNEANVRREYIDPFWRALGWDVENAAHRSRAEQEVVAEVSMATFEGLRTRARRPDYVFRVGGFPRFVVEAKKPAVDLRRDRDAILQAKTYAWSAQIPFAILTNFQETRLFDCTLKPVATDPDRGLVRDFDLAFADYPAQWDALLGTLGKEATAQGSLERLLARLKNIRVGRRLRTVDRMLIDLRGSEPVDRAFLSLLEDYRKRFARELYRANRAAFPEAETHHGAAKLTEAVQRLIDRLVFMRVCEDRDISDPGGLRGLLDQASDERTDLYRLLVAQFQDFNRRYNGYLFKPHFSEQLEVSGELLSDFVRAVYLPEGPYRFDAIGDDILGVVYERFLGNVVAVRRGQAEVDPKPEVRHAGGVYYTPRFVVNTIIRRVLGPKVAGLSPADVLGVKILDPACGSGSFLVAAFQYLIDHCEEYIGKHPAAAFLAVKEKSRPKKKPIAVLGPRKTWMLTPDFKATLLASCIHGVDIDLQAVEVTIMSLYLKLLEALPPGWQRSLLDNQLLPVLDNNIRCGNSLIGSLDFDNWWDATRKGLLPSEDDRAFRINRFDWLSPTRGFGRVLEEHHGFDCVIGNPPYIRVQALTEWAPEECDFYKWKYRTARRGNFDIYVVFVERGLELLAPRGLLGFIMPHKFWQAQYGTELRDLLARGRHIRSVIDFTHEQVFSNATTYTAIHILDREGNPGPVDYTRVTALTDGASQCEAIDGNAGPVPGTTRWRSAHPQSGDATFQFSPEGRRVVSDRVRTKPLGEVAQLSQGFKTGADGVFVVEVVRDGLERVTVRSREAGTEVAIEAAALRPLIKSEHMRRFHVRPTTLRLVFPYEISGEKWRILRPEEIRKATPRLWEYLENMRPALARREHGRFDGDLFYQYSRQQNFVPLSKPKIISPDIAERPRMSWDPTGRFVFSGGAAGGVAIAPREGYAPMFLLGLLNSRWAESVIRAGGTEFRGGYLNCEIRFLRNLPVAVLTSRASESLAAQIAECARKIVIAKEDLLRPELGQREREGQDRECEANEERLDELVFKLYGVTEKELCP